MNNQPNKKPGVSIQEIENFAKRYRLEVFYCIAFILAAAFSFFLFGTGWSIFATALGALLGVCFPMKVEQATAGIFRFVFKQERTTQMILGAVGWVFAIFLPPLVFFLLGLIGGRGCYATSYPPRSQSKDSTSG